LRIDPTRAPSDGTELLSQADFFPIRSTLAVPADWPPTLLVVIDTEEEFDWRAPPDPRRRSVQNIQFQPLLQAVFDRVGLTPAYLVDHPVATNAEAVAVLRPCAEHGRCEIGAHLHPWVTPPVEETVDAWHAFACNLPPALERRKLETLTQAINQSFGRAPTIFKAGGYGVGPNTAGILADLGYKVDSSIVPFTDFTPQGGPNFAGCDGAPFITGEGIVELPLSVHFAGILSGHGPRLFPLLHQKFAQGLRLPGIAARLSLLERLRLSPEGHSLKDMKRQTRAALAAGEQLFMLTMHSSSMLPGATEYVRTLDDRAAFLKRIGDYIQFFLDKVGGRTGVVSEVAASLAARGS
jgi:hypothetical protein